MPENSNGHCSIVFLPKNDRTVSKLAQSFSKTLGKRFHSLNDKESTEIAEFYLENKKKSKKTQCSSSENPLARTLRNKLPVEAWGYITPPTSNLPRVDHQGNFGTRTMTSCMVPAQTH